MLFDLITPQTTDKLILFAYSVQSTLIVSERANIREKGRVHQKELKGILVSTSSWVWAQPEKLQTFVRSDTR